jgi:hypothetical protein
MREHSRHARSCFEPLDAEGIIAAGAAIDESIVRDLIHLKGGVTM